MTKRNRQRNTLIRIPCEIILVSLMKYAYIYIYFFVLFFFVVFFENVKPSELTSLSGCFYFEITFLRKCSKKIFFYSID